MEKIKFEIPKKSEFISCIRLTTSSISNIYNLSIDKIEDMKVIVSEICIFFINNIKKNNKPFLIEYYLEDDKIKIEVTDKNDEKLSENSILNSEMFSLIIDSLADKYNIDYDNNRIVFETIITIR
ncbi:MAG TPA: hypothetical protein DC000_07170 [Clostridiales bacterium]|nr:hypothetical protein [Clostridiales bacterium]